MDMLPKPGTMMDTQVLEMHLLAGIRTLAIHAGVKKRKREDFSVDSVTSVRSLGLRRKDVRRWAEDYFGFKLSKEDRRRPFRTVEELQRILVRYEDGMKFFAPSL